MTDAVAVLAVISCGFISHLIGRETINIPEIFSGVHGFTGTTVKMSRFKQIHLSFLYFFIFLHCKYYVISIITPIQKIFVLVVVTLQLESVRHQQRHNPLAYMAYICLPLSLQCIVGRFSNTAVFGCFVSGERLCCRVLDHISCDKSKSGPE